MQYEDSDTYKAVQIIVACGEVAHQLTAEGDLKNAELFRQTFQRIMEDEARGACVNHPDRLARTNLDGDNLCQECADAWCRAEGQWAADQEARGQ